jgi:hypothetical protein
MSKCQARKFLAGGRCGGSSSDAPKELNGQFGKDYMTLLSQREAMDAKLWSTTDTKKAESSTAIVVQETKIMQINQGQGNQRKKDIDFVLSGDYDF